MNHRSLCHLFISLNLLIIPAVYGGETSDLDSLPVKEYVKGTQVGDSYPFTISSNHDVSDLKPQSQDDGMTDTFTLTHKDASYISVHFSNFDLPPSCLFDISDDNNGQIYTMTGRGKFDLGTFWAHHVNGDTMELTLHCDNIKDKEQASFEIDEYAAGYPSSYSSQVSEYGDHHFERRHLRSRRANSDSKTRHSAKASSFLDRMNDKRDLSICGADDKRDAVCYKTSDPMIYNKARAVARLLINGRSICTGWLVSESNLLFTNEHCIDSLSDVQNTDFEFMGEEPTCTNVAGSGWGLSHRNWSGIYDGTALLKVSATWDYALIQLSGNPVSIYGFLELDNRKAGVNEQIYIPQHPAGRPKEIGVFDSNHNGNCRVKGYRRGCSPEDMTYSCDTEGGSSGSPVLSRSTNKVVALHHCGGGCNGNLGAPIFMFYDEISQYITGTFTPVPAPTDPPVPAPTPTASDLDNYDFYSFMDSGGNDITNINGGINAAAAACNANSDCRGFNSNGWLKHTIKDQSKWSRWTNDPIKGFYVKKGGAPTSTPPTSAPIPSASDLDNYDFYPYMDSGGNDIINVSGGIDAAAAACNSNSDCRGFNSNGWLKHTIRDQSQWRRWTNDPTKGFYVKKGDTPTSAPPTSAPTPTTASSLDSYDFYSFMDSDGNDIGRVSGGIEAVAAACNANPSCQGFNSNGWIKHTLRDQSQWSRWTSDPTKGFYVKK